MQTKAMKSDHNNQWENIIVPKLKKFTTLKTFLLVYMHSKVKKQS